MIVNACLMCLADKESSDHLLLNCKLAHNIWMFILGWFHCNGPLPKSPTSFFEYWKMGVGSKRGKSMWNLTFMVAPFGVFGKRNRKCFEGLSSNACQLGKKIKYLVASWAPVYPISKRYL